MKWLLLVTVIHWCLFAWLYKAADRPGDDFMAGIVALLVGAVAAVFTLVYFGAVFWNHRFPW